MVGFHQATGNGQADAATTACSMRAIDPVETFEEVGEMLAGNAEWKHWIDNVLATSSDQNAREAASGVVTYLKALLH